MKTKTMPHQQTSKTCQNCKSKFIIEPEDFEFYQKIDVPEPTFCPDCRIARRLTFRVGRVLYKRKIEGYDKEVFSHISPQSSLRVYHSDLWFSGKRDAMKYGRDYDFSRPFLDQFKELMHQVGQGHSAAVNAVNSSYSHSASDIKDCYLTFNIGFSENCAYGVDVTNSKDCFDVLKIDNCELCYELFDCEKCYRVFFSTECRDCSDVWFSKNLVNCQN